MGAGCRCRLALSTVREPSASQYPEARLRRKRMSQRQEVPLARAIAPFQTLPMAQVLHGPDGLPLEEKRCQSGLLVPTCHAVL
mmetsp:Transcript_11288/g.24900  ORF Transcript_11288/g.24900 Transcript_11288/m.24900 type:complete len:83 (+) Transcript_11288:358-606(+)